MLICSPKEARAIYNDVADAARDKADNLNLPEDNYDYDRFRNKTFAHKSNFKYLDDGAFRFGYKVNGYVIKVPKSWAGARQNIVEHYAAMANLPFTPRGTHLVIYKHEGYEIPVLAVPFQDLGARQESFGRKVWNEVIRNYNYSNDWAQYGKSKGRIELTDWCLLAGDLDMTGGKCSSPARFGCGCYVSEEGGDCDQCHSNNCGNCSIEECSKCPRELCGDCTCGHCSKDTCTAKDCSGCRTLEPSNVQLQLSLG